MLDTSLSVEKLREVHTSIYDTKIVNKTPILRNVEKLFHLKHENIELHLKLESMQAFGSFKTRGVVNQIEKLKSLGQTDKLFSFSAGNYGKAFASYCSLNNIPGTVFIPDSAPNSRATYIKVNNYCFISYDI